MRRKATLYEQALKDAAKELHRSKDDWRVQQLATLMVMLAVARHSWTQTQSAAAGNQMLTIMAQIEALREKAGVQEPVEVEVVLVESARGIGTTVCSQCGHREQHTFEPGSLAPLPEKRASDVPIEPQPAANVSRENTSTESVPDRRAPGDKVVPIVRPNVSASKFHSQQLASGEVPPLRSEQRSYLPEGDPHPYHRRDVSHPLPKGAVR